MVSDAASADDIAANLATVRAEIAAAAREAGRPHAAITLVAVSKFHPADRIRAALRAGHRDFGENRVQEAEDKWPALRAEFPDLRLHLIGPLQSNKVKRAVALFDVIESVDREKLVRQLAREMAEQNRRPDCLIQVNTGEEPQKGGIAPAEADAFIRICRDELGLPVRGVMCIPPAEEEPSLHFTLLRDIAKRHGLAEVSMGMSADFTLAIRFGASIVRVGSAIFGHRPKAGVEVGAEAAAGATPPR